MKEKKLKINNELSPLERKISLVLNSFETILFSSFFKTYIPFCNTIRDMFDINQLTAKTKHKIITTQIGLLL